MGASQRLGKPVVSVSKIKYISYRSRVKKRVAKITEEDRFGKKEL
jgi:hypothetical protein